MDRRKTRIRGDVCDDDLLILRNGWYVPLSKDGRPGELIWKLSNSKPYIFGVLFKEES